MPISSQRAALIPTGEATVGPFFPPVEGGTNDLTVLNGGKAKGEAIEIGGRVIQEDGGALEHVVVEIWQADAAGIYRHPADPRHAQADPGFLGWGRASTDAQGRYRFRTIRPGAPAGRAAHVNFMVMYSGLMRILKTTMFFEEGPDPVLRAVPASRRKFLVAGKKEDVFIFDIRLRGENETPFFDD